MEFLFGFASLLYLVNFTVSSSHHSYLKTGDTAESCTLQPVLLRKCNKKNLNKTKDTFGDESDRDDQVDT